MTGLAHPGAQAVIDYITAGVESGTYPPGSKLPTIRELAELTGAGQTAVKSALLVLRERGVVRGRQGSGSYVAERPT